MNILQPNIINADIAGYRIIFPNDDKIYYIGTYYRQGMVYKDLNAFESGIGICYIPEYGFFNDVQLKEHVSDDVIELLDKYDVNTGYILCNVENTEGTYTREDIKQTVVDAIYQECGEHLNQQYGEKYHKFVEQLTCDVFNNIDWQYPETYLNDIDIPAYWDEFLKGNNNYGQ